MGMYRNQQWVEPTVYVLSTLPVFEENLSQAKPGGSKITNGVQKAEWIMLGMGEAQ